MHALIFTAVYSRHMFVWLTFNQTLEAIVAGCEAAWQFFGGVFKVLIPDNMTPIVPRQIRPIRSSVWVGRSTRRSVDSSPIRPGFVTPRTSRGWNVWSSTCGQLLRRRRLRRPRRRSGRAQVCVPARPASASTAPPVNARRWCSPSARPHCCCPPSSGLPGADLR
ncbi:integrase catalytic region domain protein [Mycobacterium xenopi 3993]|nr:integrase catalytic region domain protein [Mycobacterium xenopi 3993]